MGGRVDGEVKGAAPAARVLLTNTFSPWAVEDEFTTEELKYEGIHTNFTRAQGIFSPRGLVTCPCTHFISHNIQAPTVVLDNPTLGDYEDELTKGYDYLGISFLTCEFPKAKKMVETAKKLSPRTKVVLGGYGVVTPGAEDFGADYVCKGEGVEFMRTILGEPTDRPLSNPRALVAPEIAIFGNLSMGSMMRTVYFTVGLGCPFGCEFCVTSNYWGKKYIPLLETGEDIYRSMKEIAGAYSCQVVFACNQDDFLLEKKRNLELWELARREVDKPFHIWSYNSARAVSQYDPETLLEMGMDIIFIGVETQAAEEYHLGRVFNPRKQQVPGEEGRVDFRRLFRRLHENGIKTVAASILSVPAHTEESLKRDVDFHLSLAPCLSQFSCYSPFPGTPLWDKLIQNDLMVYDYRKPGFHIRDWRHFDGMSLLYKHPHITPQRNLELHQWAWEKEFHMYGPALLRFAEVEFTGFLRHKGSPRPVIRTRAEEWRERLLIIRPLVMACQRDGLGLTKAVKDRAEDFHDRLSKEFGPPSSTDGDMAEALYEQGCEAKAGLDRGETGPVQRFYRTEYRRDGKKREASHGISIPEVRLDTPSATSLKMILKEILEGMLRTQEKYERAARLGLSLSVRIDSLGATVRFGGGQVHIDDGFDESSAIRIRGDMKDVALIRKGKIPVVPFLTGRLKVRGNPLKIASLVRTLL